jgi:hypothetical protein
MLGRIPAPLGQVQAVIPCENGTTCDVMKQVKLPPWIQPPSSSCDIAVGEDAMAVLDSGFELEAPTS